MVARCLVAVPGLDRGLYSSRNLSPAISDLKSPSVPDENVGVWHIFLFIPSPGEGGRRNGRREEKRRETDNKLHSQFQL